MRHLVALALTCLLAGCGPFEENSETTYSLMRETKDEATGAYMRLWYYEGILDSGYTLERVQEKLPVRPNIGDAIISIKGASTLPTLKNETGCYVFRAPGAKYVTRFDETNWLYAQLFGSGVDLKPGDTWTETVGEKSICFRYEK